MNTYLITFKHTPNDHSINLEERLKNLFNDRQVSANVQTVWTFGAPKALVSMNHSELTKLDNVMFIQSISKQ